MFVNRVFNKLKMHYEKKILGREPDIWGPWANLRCFQHLASEREWLQLLMYYDMLKQVEDVPGDVAEFGVAGGISFISLIRIQRILERGYANKERRVFYGFDSFEGLPNLSSRDFGKEPPIKVMRKGGFKHEGAYSELASFVDRDPASHLVKGWFSETLPVFLSENPHAYFALVHIDCDLYESTKTVLDLIWDRVPAGGIIHFDELFNKNYPGESVAFGEFFSSRSGQYSLFKNSIMRDKKFIVKKN